MIANLLLTLNLHTQLYNLKLINKTFHISKIYLSKKIYQLYYSLLVFILDSDSLSF